jgi:hypothetical protein
MHRIKKDFTISIENLNAFISAEFAPFYYYFRIDRQFNLILFIFGC